MACAGALLGALAPSASAAFGIERFTGEVSRANGDAATQAGEHPAFAETTIDFNTIVHPDLGMETADGKPKSIVVDLPPGFMGNPTVVSECTAGDLVRTECSPASQVGVALLGFPDSTTLQPIFSVVPRRGEPAAFAFNFAGTIVRFNVTLRSDGDYGLSVDTRNVDQTLPLLSTKITFWGVPADPVHDYLRGYDQNLNPCSGWADPLVCSNAAGLPRRPFLTTPMDCTAGPLTTVLRTDSWANPGVFETASFDHDVNGVPMAVENCAVVPFDPGVDVEALTAEPDSPTGLRFDLMVPQLDDAAGIASAHLRKAVVTLPEGMTINPSAADGLAACSDAELKLGSRDPAACPPASKIGTVEVDTPLLRERLEGSVYVRSQASDDPASGDMFRLTIEVRSDERGIVVKLPGQVRADAQTGRLTATFDNNPQLPFSSMRVRLKGGPRAPLATPPTCGDKEVGTVLDSWSGHHVALTDTIAIACPDTTDFAPAFTAGTKSPVGGWFSPLVVGIGRDDRQQFLSGVSVDLPEGLLAKLRGVPLCGSAAAENGGCPAGSRIGTATVAAGSGSNPYYVLGDVFLTEGYKGGPYGLAVHVHAKAGPFDLGWVRVRQALHVDRTTAKVSVVSDRLPQIVKGVPVRLRSVDVDVDKSDFTINPTSCSEKQVRATLTSIGGAVHVAASRFQAGDCQALPFKPRLSLALTGKRQRTTGRHPGVKAVVRQSGVGEAAIEQAKVTLPKSLALDPDNAQALCEYEDGTKPDLESHCPKGSIVGRAKAVTPLLDRPLTGNVYFVKNVRKDPRTGNEIRTLPMIVVALRGEIAINLRGVSSTAKSGQLVTTFANVPDAPITRFNLNIQGGSNGILAVTRTRKARINLCAKPKSHIVEIDKDAHNGKRRDFVVRAKTPCAGKAKKTGAKR